MRTERAPSDARDEGPDETAIGCLAGAFLLLALIMLIYSKRVSRARTPLLGDLRREWQEDRVILEHALSSDEE